MTEYRTQLTGNCSGLKGYGAVILGGMIAAMATGQVVEFMYDGKLRLIEVHAIGLSVKDGSPVVRGFQIDGEASRPLPQWTLFSIDKIAEGSFAFYEGAASHAPRGGYSQGDKQMQVILAEIVP